MGSQELVQEPLCEYHLAACQWRPPSYSMILLLPKEARQMAKAWNAVSTAGPVAA